MRYKWCKHCPRVCRLRKQPSQIEEKLMSPLDFLQDFKEKINEFRTIEADLVQGKHKDNACTKAFSLLHDMELSYAAGAYYSCGLHFH